MALYRNFNTADTQIGKLYRFNGTDNRQIGKMNRFNGTTNTPIYSAAVQLYPDGGYTFTKGGQHDGSSVTDTLLTAKASATSTYGAVSALIDLTEVKKLIFTVSEFTPITQEGTATVGASDRQYPSTVGSYNNNNGIGVAVTGAGEYEVDVKNLTGEKYVAVSAWTTVGGVTVKVSKIVAE